MKLDDFEEQIKRTFGDVHPAQYGQIRKYIISKLREFGGKLASASMPYHPEEEGSEFGNGRSIGWRERDKQLSAQIDKELEALQ